MQYINYVLHVRGSGTCTGEPYQRGHDTGTMALFRGTRAALDFVCDRVRSKRISLRDICYDKYGRRVLARVITSEGKDLAESLVRHGLARPYGGCARGGWCPEKGS